MARSLISAPPHRASRGDLDQRFERTQLDQLCGALAVHFRQAQTCSNRRLACGIAGNLRYHPSEPGIP